MPHATAENFLARDFASQSTRPGKVAVAGHVAIIMDGNGRWATRRGLPRSVGHRAGARAVRTVVEAAPACGISTLTLYAFSSDNWNRPAGEVAALMALLETYLRDEVERCRENGVRLSVIGRRDRLAASVVAEIERAEQATAAGQQLHLRIAVDYSARQAIERAAARLANGGGDSFRAALLEGIHSPTDVPDVDLLIRSGGERRLSDFLLWECAYAELYFSPCLWPDFGRAELEEAVREFHQRERRFGRVLEAVVGAAR